MPRKKTSSIVPAAMAASNAPAQRLKDAESERRKKGVNMSAKDITPINAPIDASESTAPSEMSRRASVSGFKPSSFREPSFRKRRNTINNPIPETMKNRLKIREKEYW